MNNKKHFFKTNKFGTVSSAAFLVALAGYVGSADGQGVGITITPPVVVVAPVVVAPPVVIQDDYVYYPNYGIYYNGWRHQYAYLDGGAWVWAPAPNGVSVDVLLASPSANMNFHDSLANHYATTVRLYPRNWKPSGAHQDRKENVKSGPPDDKGKMSGQPDSHSH